MELFGIDPASLIRTVGYAGLFAIIFAESGLLVGFFLPGDSLLFTAGFLASQGYLSIWLLVVGCFLAAVLGDSVGYTFGYRVGPRIFKRERSLFFNPRNLERARRFYAIYGGKTIVLARFLPVIRTFAPILAGVGLMRYPVFLFYNLLGAGIWAIGMPLLGYFLGSVIPGVDRYLIPIILVIVIGSMLPSVLPVLREPERRAELVAFWRQNVIGNPFFRKVIGVILIAFGFIALLIPFFPFAWVGFIGLELLGLRTLFLEKFLSWRQKRKGRSPM